MMNETATEQDDLLAEAESGPRASASLEDHPNTAPGLLSPDPQMAAILARIALTLAPDYKTIPLAEARRLFEAASRPWSEGAPAMDTRPLSISLPDRTLRARLYLPEAGPLHSVAVFVHGGGWTFGSIDTHDGTMRRVAAATRCPVLGVDYRLAPEHPFPAPLDDVLATLEFVEQGGLGEPLLPHSIAVAGDSAGANLALAALISRRDAGKAALAAGALFYGCYAPEFSTASHAAYGGGAYLLTSANMRWYWRNFLGELADDTASLAAPLRVDLAGLPPLYLSAAGFDPLRDDTVMLAQRLAEAGVSFRFDHVPDVVHGCLRMARELDASQRMIEAAGDFLAIHLE
jgi:acetyl esterase